MDRSVCIVGAQGSGKTVLLSVLGHKYLNPSGKGYFLEPMNRDASDFIVRNWKLIGTVHQWPPPTPPGQLTKLDFKLHLGKDVCRMKMVDFAGEMFKDVFVDNNKTTEAHEELEKFVLKSDYVFLLVNLKDVVNRGTIESLLEGQWLPKTVLDTLKAAPGARRVALVLTQTDRYREYLRECGSWQRVVERYLPTIAGAYPGLPVLGVSAVNSVDVDSGGYSRPADEFGQEGVEELLDFIADGIKHSRNRRKKILDCSIAFVFTFVATFVVTRIISAKEKEVIRISQMVDEGRAAMESLGRTLSIEDYNKAVNKISELLAAIRMYKLKRGKVGKVLTLLAEDGNEMRDYESRAASLLFSLMKYAKSTGFQIEEVYVDTRGQPMDAVKGNANDVFIMGFKNGASVFKSEVRQDTNVVSVQTDIILLPGETVVFKAYDNDVMDIELIDAISYTLPESVRYQDTNDKKLSVPLEVSTPKGNAVEWKISGVQYYE